MHNLVRLNLLVDSILRFLVVAVGSIAFVVVGFLVVVVFLFETVILIGNLVVVVVVVVVVVDPTVLIDVTEGRRKCC